MLKNDTLKNGTSRIGLYGSAPPPPGLGMVSSYVTCLLPTAMLSVGLNNYIA